MKIKSLKVIGTFLIVALIMGIVSCGNSGQQQQRRRQQVQPYNVVKLEPRTVTLTSTYPANLRGYQTVEIRPRVQGYIEEMLVDEGDEVKKGQKLFRLNNEQYEQSVRSAKADINAAQAGVSSAKSEIERLKPLVKKDIISEYRLRSAKDKLKSQQAALAQARAALENAQVNLGYTYVKSPANGVIGTIPYRVGSLVSSTITKPLTVVSDISKVYAYFSMGERELLEMSQSVAKEGGDKNLRQRIDDMPKANLLLSDNTIYDHQGTIKLASGLIGEGTGAASFRALFPNPNQVLRSGGSGTVQIPVHKDSALVVPKKSTYEIQNKKFVYTVTDSNTVSGTIINVAPLSTDQLYVIEGGLAPGSTIVTAGMGQLQDGMKIKPQPIDGDSLYQALTTQNKPKADSAKPSPGR